MWDRPERRERKGHGKTQTKGNLTVSLIQLSFKGKCWELNSVLGGRQEQAVVRKLFQVRVYDNLPEEERDQNL